MRTCAKDMASSLKVWEWSCKDVGLQVPRLSKTRVNENRKNRYQVWHKIDRHSVIDCTSLFLWEWDSCTQIECAAENYGAIHLGVGVVLSKWVGHFNTV